MVCQFPKRLGRPRHLQPCSATQSMAFNTCRFERLTISSLTRKTVLDLLRQEATPQLFACAIERSRIKANQGLNWAYLDKTQHKLITASICFYLLNRHCVPQATNQGVVGSDPAGRAKNQAYRPDA